MGGYMKIFVKVTRYFQWASLFIFLNFFSLFGTIEEKSFTDEIEINNFDESLLLQNEDVTKSIFQPNSLSLVDYTEKNFLFRGNIPVNDDTYAYEELVEAIKKNATDNNLDLNDDFKLTVINLIGHPTLEEAEASKIQYHFFKKYPEKGTLHYHSIYTLNPCANIKIEKYLHVDMVPELMTKIHNLMIENGSTQNVIYIHDWDGKDKVAQVSACYLMQHKNKSYKSVIEMNEKILKRELNPASIKAISLYASYLRDYKKMASIGPIEQSKPICENK